MLDAAGSGTRRVFDNARGFYINLGGLGRSHITRGAKCQAARPERRLGAPGNWDLGVWTAVDLGGPWI